MDAVSFALAGVGFRVEPESGAPALPLPAAYRPFQTTPSSGAAPADVDAACRLSITPADETFTAPAPPRWVWTCETWRLGRLRNGDWSLQLHTLPAGAWITAARIAPDFSRARLRPVAGRLGEPAAWSLNYPSDQAIIVNRLLHADAVVLHASGVVHEGRAYLFCGRSGAGKTTIARLWREAGAMLLNDDRVIVRGGGQVRAAATPWHGDDDEVHAGCFPLGGIFHLAQAPQTVVKPVDGIAAAAGLVANSVAPFYSASAVERLLAVTDTVAAGVPAFALEFKPDRSALDACLEAVTGA
jgi:hypothetical protein